MFFLFPNLLKYKKIMQHLLHQSLVDSMGSRAAQYLISPWEYELTSTCFFVVTKFYIWLQTNFKLQIIILVSVNFQGPKTIDAK